MSEDMVPRSSVPLPHIVSPERFEQFVQASGLSQPNAPTAKRDRALLWVLFDTGITLSELCTLRRADVDLPTGILSVNSFALRYLQAGGDPQGLQALMGYEGMAPIRQYLRWYDQLLHDCTLDEAQQM
jgi:site-specific recombinase XerD